MTFPAVRPTNAEITPNTERDIVILSAERAENMSDRESSRVDFPAGAIEIRN